MSYELAILVLAEDILEGNFEEALTACDNFEDLAYSEKDALRSQIKDLLSDPDILHGKDINQIIDKLKFSCADVLKAIIDLGRNLEGYSTSKKIKESNAYKLLMNTATEYYSDIERSMLVRLLSINAIATHDIKLVKELLAKVQEFGI